MVSGDCGAGVRHREQDAAVGHHYLHTDTVSPSQQRTGGQHRLPARPANVSRSPGARWGRRWGTSSPSAAAAARCCSRQRPGRQQQMGEDQRRLTGIGLTTHDPPSPAVLQRPLRR